MTQAAVRVRAPELRGAGGWLNTAAPLTLEQLRGRVLVLDFWTFCCINCLRVIEELRPIEERFGSAVVVIGVHSPKFPHEADHEAVVRAVRRHRIEHPVLDDPALETWQRYGVRAWPTLVVIDQEGDIVASASGEGNGPAVAELVARLLDGTEPPPDPAFSLPASPGSGTLSYPGKVAVSEDGQLFAVADTGHDRVLVLSRDGAVTGSFGGFHQPQGVRFDADRLLVCDTVAGTLEAVDLTGGGRRTLAAGLRSPWDAVRRGGTLLVAEAGSHRLLAVPEGGGEAQPVAGTGVEGLRDGPALQAHLAQPSGLALLADGAVAFADSEVSALRVLRDGRVETLAGRGLFDWGTADGDRQRARLQHPLGVAALPDGGIAVADTFNSSLRLWRDGILTTLAIDTQLDEPGGLDVLPDGTLVVADTGNHRLLLVDPRSGRTSELGIDEPGFQALWGPPGGSLTVEAALDLDSQELDRSSGPPVRVVVTADPETLLGPGPRSWALDAVPAEVAVTLGTPGTGTLSVDVIAATCSATVCEVRRRTRRHPLTVR